MLQILSSGASPFGRKVRIAASHLGLDDRVELVETATSDPESGLRERNPLGKIPALVLEDGSALFDSRVILEYLDDLAGGDRLFPKGADRFDNLRLQALADGILDAGIVQVYERRYRPEEKVHQPWLDYQREKVTRALDVLEADLPELEVTAGTITLACALGYLDFRFPGSWRDGHPRLVGWLDAFARAVPAYGATMPE